MIALLLLAAAAQDAPELLGLTPEKVVAMGREKFFDAYVERNGYSTAAMSQAEAGFGEALRHVNDAWIAANRPELAGAVGRLRPMLASFTQDCFFVGECLTGGGTIWHPVYSGIVADVEETVSALVGRSKTAPRAAQAKVWSTLERLEATVAKEILDPEAPGRSLADARARLAAARQRFYGIVQESAAWPASRRPLLFGYAESAVGTAFTMFGG